MTNKQFYQLATQMFSYSPYSNKGSQKLFLRTIRENSDAMEEAKSFFPTGDSLYSASSNALTKFVTMHYGYTSKEDLQRNIKGNLTQNKRKDR